MININIYNQHNSMGHFHIYNLVVFDISTNHLQIPLSRIINYITMIQLKFVLNVQILAILDKKNLQQAWGRGGWYNSLGFGSLCNWNVTVCLYFSLLCNYIVRLTKRHKNIKNQDNHDILLLLFDFVYVCD